MTPSLLVAATLATGVLIGLIPILVDNLKKLWQVRLSLPPERLEWGTRLFYFSWLFAMPLTGWLLDQWHGYFKEFLFFGVLALILALAWLGMVRTFSALLGNMLLLGIAYSVVTVTSVRLMTLVLFPEPDYPVLASLNFGFIAVGFGALIAPAISSMIERWWGYRQGLLFLSLACILPAALAALSERALYPELVDETNPWRVTMVHPHMAMIAAVIFIYFAMENCLEFWPEPYLRELRYDHRALKTGLLLFWLAFIAMRGAAAWWFYLHPTHAIPMTLVLVVVSAVVMGNLAGGYEVGSGSLGFWLAGACYGPLLPSFLGIALLVDDHLPASVLGVLLSLSGLDTLIVRPLMQSFVANRRARTIMRVPTILALILAAPFLLLAFLR